MRFISKPPDKTFLAYLLLAAFALVHLASVLSQIPSILPYTSDDVWMSFEGLNTPVGEMFISCWGFVRGMGRLSLFLNNFIYGFVYHFPAAAYILQSFPLFLCIATGAILLRRYTRSWELALSFSSLMGFGSFIAGQYHLFGAYPAALPLALTCSMGYLFFGLYAPAIGWPTMLARVTLFTLPLFIYEAFFPLQIAAAGIIAAHRLTVKPATGAVRKLLSAFRPVMAEFTCMCLVFIGYIIVSHIQVTGVYQGATLAHSFKAMPYTFLAYATGFFALPMAANGFILSVTLGWFCYASWKGYLPHFALACYCLVLWLAPPLLLALTPKYQLLATAKGETLYVTTFLSEMGCFGLLVLLWQPCGRVFLLCAVTALSLFMWLHWCEKSSLVLHERLTRFAMLDAAIAKKKNAGTENCFTEKQTQTLLNPWVYCDTEPCRKVTSYLLSQRGSRLCTAFDDNSH